MGYNSVIFICNDSIDQIDKNLEAWWTKTKSALSMVFPDGTLGRNAEWAAKSAIGFGSSTDLADYGIGNHANGCQAVYCAHADYTALIAVGGNYATVLGQFYTGYKHHDHDSQVKLLRALADKLGYRLIKKTAKD